MEASPTKSCFTPEEQSFFCFDDIKVTASEESLSGGITSIEPVIYLESLEQRVNQALKASNGFHDLVSIAEAYDDDSKINIRLNTTPVASNTLHTLLDGMSVKEYVTMDTPFGTFEVPIPTTQAIPKYNKVLSQAAAASIRTLKDLTNLTDSRSVDMAATVENISTLCKEEVQKHSKSKDRREILASILSVMMIERFKERELAEICEDYSKPEMWVDPLTEGLWIVNPAPQHPAVNAARVRKVVSVYELDDNQTQSLIALSFSKAPWETAAAKLNLFSRIRDEKKSDIKANPRKVLARVFSEAELGQNEVKAMIFLKPRETVASCPACNTHVEIEGITYHPECAVITWLVDNFFFKYDKQLGVLSTQTVVYLDHNQRCLLESIQKHHRTLNSPFKIKGGAKYTVMQREGNTLKTLTNLTTNPAHVPGTAEWIDKKKQEVERNRHRSSK